MRQNQFLPPLPEAHEHILDTFLGFLFIVQAVDRYGQQLVPVPFEDFGKGRLVPCL